MERMNITKGIDWFRGGDTMENLTAKILTAAWREDEACWCPHAQVKRGIKGNLVFEKPLFAHKSPMVKGSSYLG